MGGGGANGRQTRQPAVLEPSLDWKQQPGIRLLREQGQESKGQGQERAAGEQGRSYSGTGTITGHGDNSRAVVCYPGEQGKSGSTQLPVLEPSLDMETTAGQSSPAQANRDREDQARRDTPAPNLHQEGRAKAPPLINGLASQFPQPQGPDPPDALPGPSDGPEPGPADSTAGLMQVPDIYGDVPSHDPPCASCGPLSLPERAG